MIQKMQLLRHIASQRFKWKDQILNNFFIISTLYVSQNIFHTFSKASHAIFSKVFNFFLKINHEIVVLFQVQRKQLILFLSHLWKKICVSNILKSFTVFIQNFKKLFNKSKFYMKGRLIHILFIIKSSVQYCSCLEHYFSSSTYLFMQKYTCSVVLFI